MKFLCSMDFWQKLWYDLGKTYPCEAFMNSILSDSDLQKTVALFGFSVSVRYIAAAVLAAALGCVLTRQSVAALRCDLPRLNALLAGKSRQETEKLLRQAAEVFIRGAGCPEGLAAYLRRSVPPLAGEMARAVALGHPEAAVPVPAEW